MSDPGFVPGLIGVFLQSAIGQIFKYIGESRRCKKALADLRNMLTKTEPIIALAVNKHKDGDSAYDDWFKQLQKLLEQASEIAKKCAKIPRLKFVSRNRASRKIADLSKDIDKHLTLSGLVNIVKCQEQTQMILDGQKQMKEALDSLINSASTSQPAHTPKQTINRRKGNKTVTGTASRRGKLSKFSSFQALDSLLSRDGPATSYDLTIMQLRELYENSMAGPGYELTILQIRELYENSMAGLAAELGSREGSRNFRETRGASLCK